MGIVDWSLFALFLSYVVWDGIRRGRDNRTAEDYFLAGRSIPWWGVGLSIMATQASAITMVGTTGQGWADGLRFVQFYFALPLAMILLAVTAVPAYHRARVTTAYEWLGVRFDLKTRLLGAMLFLILRGLSVGFVIYTPSLVLSKVFALPLAVTVVVMGGVAVFYTSLGGLRAVIATDVKQMGVMVVGLLVALVVLLCNLPGDWGWSGSMRVADAAGRLDVVDWRWDPSEKYTVWSSLLGGLFLFLSYFGTDQSQVQRLLAGRSVGDTQRALMLNALAKVPFQFLVLTIGVLLFVVYLGWGEPLTFEPTLRGSTVESTGAYQALETEFTTVRESLQDAAGGIAAGDAVETDPFRQLLEEQQRIRGEARDLRGGVGDTNYVFLDFILNHLPLGLAGLLLAAIFAAALSSIDSEINSMTTVVVNDAVQLARRRPLEGAALLRWSRLATLGVGLFATLFALYAGEVGSLIEAVNRVGSYIYGSLLGAFLLAFLMPRSNGTGAFVGLLAGMGIVFLAAQTGLAFLYLNTVGVVSVVVVGGGVSLATRGDRPPA